jgi:type IV pilus assembly protein PilC
LLEMRSSLINGEPLSVAMERLPKVFDTITLNLVRAAEMGGTLEDTLGDIVKNKKKELAFSDSLRTTMVYPAFVAVVFGAIVLLMLTFVLPRIAKVFTSLRVQIPWTTQLLFKASEVFMDKWVFIAGGFLIVTGLTGIVIAKNGKFIVRMLLGLPGLRSLGLAIDMARFTRNFGLLLGAGIPLNETLRLSEKVVQNKKAAEAIVHMQANVEAGKPVSAGLRDNTIIPHMMIRSIETAEHSGTLEKTMHNLAEFYNDQVESKLKVVSSLVEPVLIIVVGVLVGLLVVSIIAPIYNLMSQINQTQR